MSTMRLPRHKKKQQRNKAIFYCSLPSGLTQLSQILLKQLLPFAVLAKRGKFQVFMRKCPIGDGEQRTTQKAEVKTRKISSSDYTLRCAFVITHT